jgi:hypothetical protein
MKRKIIALTLVLMFIATTATQSIAADGVHHTGDSASMQVTLTLTEDCVDPWSYTVIIPSTFNFQNGGKFQIAAVGVTVPPDKKVVVAIDGGRTFESDGNFYLYSVGLNETRRILCNLRRGTHNSMGDLINGPNNTTVAEFGYGEMVSRTYGYVYVLPQAATFDVPGDYTGRLYFKISIENA